MISATGRDRLMMFCGRPIDSDRSSLLAIQPCSLRVLHRYADLGLAEIGTPLNIAGGRFGCVRQEYQHFCHSPGKPNPDQDMGKFLFLIGKILYLPALTSFPPILQPVCNSDVTFRIL